MLCDVLSQIISVGAPILMIMMIVVIEEYYLHPLGQNKFLLRAPLALRMPKLEILYLPPILHKLCTTFAACVCGWLLRLGLRCIRPSFDGFFTPSFGVARVSPVVIHVGSMA